MRPNPQKLTTVARPTITKAGALSKAKAMPDHNNGNRKIWEKGQASTWGVRRVGNEIAATLPYPPSSNEYWRHRVVIPKQGKPFVSTYLSEDAVAYKSLIAQIFGSARIKPVLSAFTISYRMFRPQQSGDLMNREKVLSDALIGHAWTDDDQIREGHFYLDDDKLNPRIEVTISPHAAANGVLEFE